jgi:hypothetical protein
VFNKIVFKNMDEDDNAKRLKMLDILRNDEGPLKRKY